MFLVKPNIISGVCVTDRHDHIMWRVNRFKETKTDMPINLLQICN